MGPRWAHTAETESERLFTQDSLLRFKQVNGVQQDETEHRRLKKTFDKADLLLT